VPLSMQDDNRLASPVWRDAFFSRQLFHRCKERMGMISFRGVGFVVDSGSPEAENSLGAG
jgi:hypothetical protein